MIKNITYLLLSAILLIGCSVQKETVNSNADDDLIEQINPEAARNAMDHFINGTIAELKGDYAGAILEFQDAIKLNPDPGIFYAMAKNYYFLGKLSLALENAKHAVQMDPEQVEYRRLMADIYSSGHQNDSAAVVLEKIINIDSTDISSYYKLARIYEINRPLEAITIYNKLTDQIGPEWSVLIRIAELNEKLGNYSDAAATVKRLLVIDPSNVALKKLLSELYEKDEKYDEALKTLNEILELTPDDLDARERKADLFIKQDKWEQASKEYAFILMQPDVPLRLKIRVGASYFNQSLKDSTLLPIAKKFFSEIDKDTTDWQVKMYLGGIAINEKNDSAAIKNFKEVTELARWNPQGWIRLGGLYFDNKRYDDAVKVMQEAVQSFPEDFAVNLILGLSYGQKGDNSEAKPYLKKAVNLNSSDVTALSAYAYTLSQLKENKDAIKYLQMALKLDPGNVDLLGTLGLIYDGEKDWQKCDSVYQKAIEIDSTNALVNNNYAYSLSERGIKLDEALRMAKVAVTAEPDNSSYLDTIGWIYFKLGNNQKAKQYLEKALKVDSEKPVVLEHLGDVSFKMGNKKKAIELWNAALKLDSSNDQLKQKIEKGEL